MKITVIIAAGGSSARMGGINKQFSLLGGIPVIMRSALAFENCAEITGIIIVTSQNDVDRINALCKEYHITKLIKTVCGGNSRAESVKKGAAFLDNCDVVAIHDGARPLVSQRIISETVAAAAKYGAAFPSVPVKDTIKKVENNFVVSTPERSRLVATQTPQAFLRNVYDRMLTLDGEFTDDCQLAEQLGVKVYAAQGDNGNIKITTPEDLQTAETLLKDR